MARILMELRACSRMTLAVYSPETCQIFMSMLLRFLSGPNHFNKILACEKFIARNRDNHSLWMDLSELIAKDRRCEVCLDDIPATLDEWARDPAINNRGLYVARLILLLGSALIHQLMIAPIHELCPQNGFCQRPASNLSRRV